MAKRKSDTQVDNSDAKKESKPVKRTKKASADSIDLTYEAFEKSAPNLSFKLYEAKKGTSKTSSDSGRTEILDVDLPKALHSTGSYGYTSSGKRIMVEVEVDGKKEKVPALVTVNVTIVGSKKAQGNVIDSD